MMRKDACGAFSLWRGAGPVVSARCKSKDIWKHRILSSEDGCPDRNVSSSYERELNMSALRMKKIKYFFVMGTKIPKELYDFRCYSILALG